MIIIRTGTRSIACHRPANGSISQLNVCSRLISPLLRLWQYIPKERAQVKASYILKGRDGGMDIAKETFFITGYCKERSLLLIDCSERNLPLIAYYCYRKESNPPPIDRSSSLVTGLHFRDLLDGTRNAGVLPWRFMLSRQELQRTPHLFHPW
jgi:hypothetical protein